MSQLAVWIAQTAVKWMNWSTRYIFWALTMSGKNPDSLQVLHLVLVVLVSWLMQSQPLEPTGRGNLHSLDCWNQQTQLSRSHFVQPCSHEPSLSSLHPVSWQQKAKHVTQEWVFAQRTCVLHSPWRKNPPQEADIWHTQQTVLVWACAAIIYASVHHLNVEDKLWPAVNSAQRLNTSADLVVLGSSMSRMLKCTDRLKHISVYLQRYHCQVLLLHFPFPFLWCLPETVTSVRSPIYGPSGTTLNVTLEKKLPSNLYDIQGQHREMAKWNLRKLKWSC